MLTLLFCLVVGSLTVSVTTLTIYLLFLAAVYYLVHDHPLRSHPPQKRFAVIIPAHNEALHLPRTIDTLKTCSYPEGLSEIFVVADNCTDDTKEVATATGTRCLVREEPTLPGKNHALRWGLQRIDLEGFDAVAIIDADTIVEKNFLGVVNDYLCAGHRAVQVSYRIKREENGPFGILQELGNTAENLLFYGGRRKLGFSAFLRGNGMAFAKELLSRFPFEEKSTTEDLEYTARLLDSRERIEFALETEVSASTPPSLGSSFSQRTRWASGTLGVCFRYLLRFLRRGILEGRGNLLEATLGFLSLSRPTLLYLSLILLSVSLLLLPSGLSLLFSILNLFSILLLVIYLFLAIPFEKEKKRALRSLLTAPLFALYLGAVQLLALLGVNRGRWIRTARE
jgi:1,2-diacylglycerol 3-beta-glucosyltransferase